MLKLRFEQPAVPKGISFEPVSTGERRERAIDYRLLTDEDVRLAQSTTKRLY